MPLRILSIDWDYFFPDSFPYDMGHSEHHGEMLQNILWSTRAASHNQSTGEALLDAYVPTIPQDFWDIVDGRPSKVYVADSHFKIWEVLQKSFLAQVTSLDAHHDCGYTRQTKPYVDCSSWGKWGKKTGLIGRLDLWYPQWRKTEKEGYGSRIRPTTVNYGLPAPAEYDAVFICRSGAWTPPWFDDMFLRFCNQGSCEFLQDVSPRGISLEQARTLKAEFEATFKHLRRAV